MYLLCRYTTAAALSSTWHHILSGHISQFIWFQVYHIFRTWRDELARAGPSPSFEALPLRTAGLLPCRPEDCICVADSLVPSLANSCPVVGMPLWRRVLVRRSRSRDIGRGDVAENRQGCNESLCLYLTFKMGMKF